ncbi:MAG: TIGR04211 family SH3 domain-containing protein [Chromatiales bacterium]|nr:TIGR04211 family SH3 domain-containing protein [Chromatiales bacterium]
MRHRLLAATICALLAAGQGSAATRYVTDDFKVTVRSGPSTEHRIVRMLGSGTAVSLDAQAEQDGYVRISTPDGKEGWILSHQLMEQPSARDRLAASQQRFDNADARIRAAEQKQADLQAEASALRSQSDQLQNEKARVQAELAELKATAENALAIAAERDRLRGEVAALEETTARANAARDALADATEQRWFLVGGGVLGAGILLGLLLPNLRKKRRESWDRL